MSLDEPMIAVLLALGIAVMLWFSDTGAVLRTRLSRGTPADKRGGMGHRAPAPSDPASAHRAAADRVLEACMSEAALWFSADGALLRASASASAVLGLSPAALLNPADIELRDELGIHAVLPTLSALRPHEETTIRVRRPDRVLTLLHARCHPDPEGADRIVMLRDVTHERQTELRLEEARERVARLANEDALTGLANRAWFLESTERLLAGVEPLAMLFMNLDRFAPINNVHGPGVGDLILRKTASRLARELAEAPIVARLGADEYAVLLRAPDGDEAVAARARDILRVIHEPIEVGAMTLDVAATIGIAVSPRDGVRAGTLLRAAGIAMSEARLAGGACYRFFERRMSDDLTTAEELKADLRAAIAAGEITPYFQPLLRLSDQTVTGFEVLARWDHPDRGVLPPAMFLSLVEESGLSAPMLASVLSQACAAAREWPDHVKLAVNISPTELQDESLPEDIGAVLQAAGFDARRIEIEVTEQALIHDSRVTRGVVDRLRALGMTMALDDFGTGFSSLYHLKELSFDKVKIDQDFLHGLGSDAANARYVAAIVGLGHALGLELTAEGVEDAASVTLLREMGCTYGQGYYLGRPMTAAEATRLLTATAHTPMIAAA